MSSNLLAEAVKNNNDHGLEVLLRNGVDPNTSVVRYEMQDYTPLKYACKRGFDDVVRVLLKHGARVNLADEGNSPVYLAVIYGHVKCLELLLDSIPKERMVRWGNGCHLLHTAARKGDIRCLKLLLGKGNIDVNVANKYGDTILHTAAVNEQIDVIEFLLTSTKISIVENNARKTALQVSSSMEVANYMDMMLKQLNGEEGGLALTQETKITRCKNKLWKREKDIEKLNDEIKKLDKIKKNLREKVQKFTQEKQSLEKELEDYLAVENEKEDELWKECPVCAEVMSGKIFQCNEGHCICGECKKQINKCPICPVDISCLHIRNRALEQRINDNVE